MKLNLVQKEKKSLYLKRREAPHKEKGSKYAALQNKIA